MGQIQHTETMIIDPVIIIIVNYNTENNIIDNHITNPIILV